MATATAVESSDQHQVLADEAGQLARGARRRKLSSQVSRARRGTHGRAAARSRGRSRLAASPRISAAAPS